jgi:predicted Zn-dependent protease
MSTPKSTADTAFRVAEHLKHLKDPWDVYGERTRSYELHLGGKGVELTRGPILMEGYGLRVLHPRGEKTATGFQASTDASAAGIDAVLKDADSVARYSEFPAKNVSLPSGAHQATPDSQIADSALWSDAPRTLSEYAAAVFAAFEGRKGVTVSFGSVKAACIEVTMANSAGLSASYAHTTVGFELAVKAYDGPEGPAPGEYWVDTGGRRLEPARLPQLADQWSRYAEDARRAKSPPSGDLAVVVPPSVLDAILPAALAMKLSGRGQLRDLSPPHGSLLGQAGLTLIDDGTIPWALGTSPWDDEGTPQGQHPLVADGVSSGLLYDAMYGNALGHPSTGNGVRSAAFQLGGMRRFTRSPGPSTSTLSIRQGTGGTDEELIEAAGDGIWVQQLGWASPDPLTTAFGGEIRIGYRIRHGKLAEPIRGGTLGGLVVSTPGTPSLMSSLAAIGSTPELGEGVFVPSVLVRPLTVAGESAAAATSVA